MKILGALDTLVALVFWLFGIFHLDFISGFIMVLGFYLLIKGINHLCHAKICCNNIKLISAAERNFQHDGIEISFIKL